MPIHSIRLKGIYTDIGAIRLENGKLAEWRQLCDENPPDIPFGTKIEITIHFNNQDFLSGKNGIVWATYDNAQAETIQNSLLAQNILSDIREFALENGKLYLIHVFSEKDVEKAMDFIWRDATGLRLQLDWHYPANRENKSYRKWIMEI